MKNLTLLGWLQLNCSATWNLHGLPVSGNDKYLLQEITQETQQMNLFPLSLGCGERKIDGFSDEAFRRSFEKMKNDLIDRPPAGVL